MNKRDLVVIGLAALLVSLVCGGCCICAFLISTLLPSEERIFESYTITTRSTAIGIIVNTKLPIETQVEVIEEPTTHATETPVPHTPSVEVLMETPKASPTSTIALATQTPKPGRTATREGGLIPGILPDDVHTFLLERGFECSDQYRGVLYISRMCTIEEEEYVFIVEYYGRTQNIVDLVEGVVILYGFPNDKISADLLGFLATVPYDEAEPETARRWVEQSLPTLTGDGLVMEEQVGGVVFRLYGPQTARTLEIGDLP